MANICPQFHENSADIFLVLFCVRRRVTDCNRHDEFGRHASWQSPCPKLTNARGSNPTTICAQDALGARIGLASSWLNTELHGRAERWKNHGRITHPCGRCSIIHSGDCWAGSWQRARSGDHSSLGRLLGESWRSAERRRSLGEHCLKQAKIQRQCMESFII